MAGDAGLIPGSGTSLEKNMVTHSSILAWEVHGLRSLVGYRPRGCKRVRHDLTTKTNNKQIKYAQREIRGVNVNLGVVSIEIVVLRS